MALAWKENLEKNMDLIVAEINDSVSDIVYSLEQSKFITRKSLDEYYSLLDNPAAKPDVTRDILKEVLLKIETGMPLLIKALMKENLNGPATFLAPDLVQECYSNIGPIMDNLNETVVPYGIVPSQSLPNFQYYPSATDDGATSTETSVDAEYFEGKKQEIRVEISKEIYGDDNGDEIYKNSSMPRGRVFIANFETFDNDQHQRRSGSSVDLHKLIRLFSQMGYEIREPLINATKGEFLKAMTEFADDERLRQMDSAIVIIMSHGKGNTAFYTRDNQTINNHDVINKLNSANCEYLTDKPKIFIFQHCRGELEDYGVQRSAMSNVELCSNVQTDGKILGVKEFYTTPCCSDICAIYASIEGYVAYRDPNLGSWLIEALCDVFMKHAHNNDLTSLMQMVSKKIKKKNQTKKGKQVVEWKHMGFDKYFYFNPYPILNNGEFSNLQDLRYALPETSPHRRRHSSRSNIDTPGTPGTPRTPDNHSEQGAKSKISSNTNVPDAFTYEDEEVYLNDLPWRHDQLGNRVESYDIVDKKQKPLDNTSLTNPGYSTNPSTNAVNAELVPENLEQPFENPNHNNENINWSGLPGYDTWKRSKTEEELNRYNKNANDSSEDVLDHPGIKRQLSAPSDKEALGYLNKMKSYIAESQVNPRNVTWMLHEEYSTELASPVNSQEVWLKDQIKSFLDQNCDNSVRKKSLKKPKSEDSGECSINLDKFPQL